MSSRVLVTGASGFIGSHLCDALVEAGHSVRAMTRSPGPLHRRRGARRAVTSAIPASLDAALEGVDVAYYLVHSLDSADFEHKDADAARAFGQAAARRRRRAASSTSAASARTTATCRPTCARRREVETLLGAAGVPVTVLRAAVVVGHGGISWEITRQLVHRLPAMIAPALGQHQDPADRRCPTSSATWSGCSTRRGPGPGLRGRRPGGAALRRHDAPGRAASRRAATCGWSACRCSPRSCPRCGWRLVTDVDQATAAHPDRLDDQRGGRPRHLDPRRRARRDRWATTTRCGWRWPSVRREQAGARREARPRSPRRARFRARAVRTAPTPASATRRGSPRGVRRRATRAMTPWSCRLAQLLRPALVDKVDRDHRQPDSAFLRRRIVVGVVLVIGATLLGISLSVPPGSPAFYPLTLALAATWVVGGFASGPLHLGRIPFRGTLRRPVVTPIVLGLAGRGGVRPRRAGRPRDPAAARPHRERPGPRALRVAAAGRC